VKTIVFAATKGGVGKSTLTYNVAVAASEKHQVLIADLDPQRSLKRMWERRGELLNPRLVSNVSDLGESVKLLTEAGYDKEFMFADTPGSMMPVIRNALLAADLIVSPRKPWPISSRALGCATA
jgi:chromosome partitioning protein